MVVFASPGLKFYNKKNEQDDQILIYLLNQIFKMTSYDDGNSVHMLQGHAVWYPLCIPILIYQMTPLIFKSYKYCNKYGHLFLHW